MRNKFNFTRISTGPHFKFTEKLGEETNCTKALYMKTNCWNLKTTCSLCPFF